MQMLMQAVAMIQQALPHLPPGSPMHRDALQAATRLSRHANQGQPTAGIQQTGIQDLLKNVMRNALLQKIMGQQGQGGQQGAPGAGQPSTPLPGA
jgi:hypothetical protein